MPLTHADIATLMAQPGTVLLDTIRPGGDAVDSLLFTAPVRLLVADTVAAVPALLAELDAAVSAGHHVAGYLAYEAGFAFEAIGVPGAMTMPPAWFGVYDAPQGLTPGEMDALLAPFAGIPYRVDPPRFSLDRSAFHEKIGAVKALIHDGEVYQVNFTGRYRFGFEGSATALYHDLRQKQRLAYGAWIRTDDGVILSRSPELFFRRDGRRVETRPMKGTLRRGRTLEEDTVLRDRLYHDAKSRAENLMIVDLLRNDLSVCCRPGSVKVPALFTIEPYETLFQMTSTVEGELRDGVGYAELIRALFPCGSVTGAPKIRAMQHIHALEEGPRGVYCGAIGHAAPGGQALFNVAIRTLVLQEGQGVMGTGSGVVWDSQPDAEFDECLLKTRFLTDPAPARRPSFKLIETMRWEDGVCLLDLHLDRLRASARYFGYPFDEPYILARIQEDAAGLPEGVAARVRLTLDAEGRVEVATIPLAPPRPGPLRISFAAEPMDEQDVFLFHKTTRRERYETAYTRARALGFDEAVFVNTRGEITEGSRSNVFIKRGGAFYTPPVSSGLLGGVYRRYLLESLRNAQEAVLRPADLLDADAVYVCNAVWGLRLAEVTSVADSVSSLDEPVIEG
jgi:para-aminobenzoate synthetase/4-amino-4-deoxychorismate lyase